MSARAFVRPAPGYILVLVLVALVAMAISGIALLRSMDTNQLVAGNLAARSASLHSGDQAVAQAVAWMQANTNLLGTDVPASGYYAEEQEPNWQAGSTWSACAGCTSTDPAGNTVSWVVHRMCTKAGSTNATGQFCAAQLSSSTNTGSQSSDAITFIGSSLSFYRITVQVMGPRNTSTLSQAFVTM
jgi:Tfp pilus assembly protein PilX